ncbi:MAG: D-alanyl-D-alanine carboxypeptidase/D-alanyl-D-alanine-endopeptidase [Gemmatimonadetes bacterium]|nr:D-alanyl-D-alanine carboxypeptidase/D-alanyl-D-alanine-endopeptidase [Gemmatimonadota bacterium]
MRRASRRTRSAVAGRSRAFWTASCAASCARWNGSAVNVRSAWPALVVLAACTGAPVVAPSLVPVATFAASDPLAGAQWGVLAVDLASGETVLERNSALRMIPASTMKIATTVAALDVLGPDYRWRTDLYTSAAIDSTAATLRGDLVLPGTGDPSLSRRWWKDDPGPLEMLAAALPDNGVTHVTGALVIDASRWDSTTVQGSWMVDDLPFDFSATGGAFGLEEGTTLIEVRGGAEPGAPVSIKWWPYGEEGFVRSWLITGVSDVVNVTASYLPESRVLEFTGAVPVGRIDTLVVATRDPVRQSAAALYRALRDRGVAIDGGWRIEWDPGVSYGQSCVTGSVPPCPFGRLLRGLGSPPLLEVIAGVLEPSQNWIAEQMIRTLGDPVTGHSSWSEGTAAAARDFQDVVGLDPLDFRVVDGSGLSVQNLLTPRALVQLLRHAHSRPWGAAFRSALPSPGEVGSTLAGRLPDLSGRLFAKTGSLTNVGTFAGYLIDARDREIAFAVMVNGSNLPAVTVRDGIDAVVRLLAAGR